jgi:hypothetical protein
MEPARDIGVTAAGHRDLSARVVVVVRAHSIAEPAEPEVSARVCTVTTGSSECRDKLNKPARPIWRWSQADTKVSLIPSSDGFTVAPLISYVEEIRT